MRNSGRRRHERRRRRAGRRTARSAARRRRGAPVARYAPGSALAVLCRGRRRCRSRCAASALFQFTQVLIYAIALLGLNMLTGYNGQISLGHGAFYAIGAYTTAIMIDRWNVPYGWTIPVAGIVCLVVGFLFGRPALRLEGLYLALATFALALAVPQILKYFEHWTGGSQGIVLSKPQGALRPAAHRGPVALLLHPGRGDRPVRPGLEPPARPRRAGHRRHPRQPHRRRGHGRRQRALQVRGVRRQRGLHRASPARSPPWPSRSSRPTRSTCSCRSRS